MQLRFSSWIRKANDDVERHVPEKSDGDFWMVLLYLNVVDVSRVVDCP